MSSRKRRKKSKRKVRSRDTKLTLTEFRREIIRVLKLRVFIGMSPHRAVNGVRVPFVSLPEDLKVKHILSFGKEGETEFRTLCEKKISWNQTRSLFGRTFKVNDARKEIPGKSIVIDCLVDKFFGREPAYIRRQNEEGNLREMNAVDLRNIQSVEMFGNYLNFDMIHIIFSYLKFKKPLFLNLGYVCKGFYTKLLLSWPELVIHRKKLYKYPTILLQNVREIKLTDGRLTKAEVKYLFNLLSKNKRLRRIIFKCTTRSYEKTIENLIKQSFQLDQVTEIKFSLAKKQISSLKEVVKHASQSRWYTDWYDMKNGYKSYPTGKVFPSVTSFEHPLIPEIMMNECKKLKKLKIKKRVSKKVDSRKKREEGLAYYDHIYYTHLPENVTDHFETETTKLEELDLEICHENDIFLNIFAKSLLECYYFRMIRKLTLTIEMTTNTTLKKLRSKDGIDVYLVDLSDILRLLPNLSDFSLRTTNSDSRYAYKDRKYWSINVLYSATKFFCSIEKLDLYYQEFYKQEPRLRKRICLYDILPKLKSFQITTDFMMMSLRELSELLESEKVKNLNNLRTCLYTQQEQDGFESHFADIFNYTSKIRIEKVHFEFKISGDYKSEKGKSSLSREMFSGGFQYQPPWRPHNIKIPHLDEFRDHCVIIDRVWKNGRKGKLLFALFTLNGLGINPNGEKVKQIFKKTIDPLMNHLEKLSNGMKTISIVVKEEESNLILYGQKKIDDVLVKKLGFTKEGSLKEFSEERMDEWDVNFKKIVSTQNGFRRHYFVGLYHGNVKQKFIVHEYRLIY